MKQELTTRDDYLATRFTKLSASGHDLTPLTPDEASISQQHETHKVALLILRSQDYRYGGGDTTQEVLSQSQVAVSGIHARNCTSHR